MKFNQFTIILSISFFLLSSLFIGLLADPAYGKSKDPSDWKFYKKHGVKSKHWNKSVKRGFAAYDRQDCHAVINELSLATSGHGQDPIALFKMALCSEALGSHYSAEQYYKSSQRGLINLRAPHRYQKEIFINYGRLLFKLKRYEEALPLLTRASDLNLSGYMLYFMLAEIYHQKGLIDSSAIFYEKAMLQSDASQAPAVIKGKSYTVIGLAYFNKKEYSKSLQIFELAKEEIPMNPEIHRLIREAKAKKTQEDYIQKLDRLKKFNEE